MWAPGIICRLSSGRPAGRPVGLFTLKEKTTLEKRSDEKLHELPLMNFNESWFLSNLAANLLFFCCCYLGMRPRYLFNKKSVYKQTRAVERLCVRVMAERGDGALFYFLFYNLAHDQLLTGPRENASKSPPGKILLPILDVNGRFYVRFKEIYQHSGGYNEQHKNRRNATARALCVAVWWF